MRAMGLAGIRRGKKTVTTISNPKTSCPQDKVNREFRVSRPNALWVVDFTYTQRLAEVIWRLSSWPGVSAVEMATLRWVDWLNNRRLSGPIGYIPAAEAEANYYAALEMIDRAASLKPNSLRETWDASGADPRP
ncbi:hypothetical protein C7453_108122 [Gluconacetobacter liquefaciens]|uniref:Integrase-like protein n=1 Tax=Gluconacetobacter liquefaciens TaxID=89584 RepID=A0A370G0T1_GLULI|nr:hypothetical protein C7453_108122 [Gluconacetobacter liquefaciens]